MQEPDAIGRVQQCNYSQVIASRTRNIQDLVFFLPTCVEGSKGVPSQLFLPHPRQLRHDERPPHRLEPLPLERPRPVLPHHVPLPAARFHFHNPDFLIRGLVLLIRQDRRFLEQPPQLVNVLSCRPDFPLRLFSFFPYRPLVYSHRAPPPACYRGTASSRRPPSSCRS